jgi:hypothetical protein
LTTLNVSPGSINLQGDIVGTLGSAQGFVRSHTGALTDFNLPGYWATGYLNINNLGYVMGGYSIQLNSSAAQGFIRAPNGVITSFNPPNSSDTEATSLNNFNLVTGFYYAGTDIDDAIGFIRLPDQY